MVRCRPFAHAASTREADLPVKFHAENTPALPANRKGQSGKVLLCPQQDNLTTSVAHFCIAVLRYNRTVRNEWLGTNIFHSIQDVQDYATKWLWTYNNDRPNMGIGGITPAMKLNQYQMAA